MIRRFATSGAASSAAMLVAALTAGGCRGRIASPAPTTAPDSALVMRDVRYLASDRLEGRGTGTPGNDSAAVYIARRFAALGLVPAFPVGDGQLCRGVTGGNDGMREPRGRASATAQPDGGAVCDPRYIQPFVARSVAAAHAGLPSELPTQNVAAVLPGSDAALRDEYVIVGAHFDHLGRRAMGALDPDSANAIRNGADDNASGTAAVLELARVLRQQPAKRSVLFVAFSGEELGVLGSQYFVDHLPVPAARVRAMLNFDMVGRLRDNRLIVYGAETAAEWKEIIARANGVDSLEITATGDGFGASDHTSFYAKGLPVLHFFTNVHDDYHKASDDAEKVNGAGIARIVAVAERITRDVGDRPSPLTFVRAAASAPTTSVRENTTAYLGSIPDMGATEVTGVRLTGVRAGSPADVAGIRAGDIVIELGGKPVKDLYAYTDALYAHKPGDVVDVVVLRGGQRLTMRVTLGRRGS